MKNQVKKIKGLNHYFTATANTYVISNDYNLHFELNKSTGEVIETNVTINEWASELLIELYKVAVKLENAKPKKVVNTNNLIDGVDVIGKYVSRYLYSDVCIVGKIVATRGNVLVIEELMADKNLVKMEYEVGGFSATCTNQHKQEWSFAPTGKTIEVRYSAKAFYQIHRMRITDSPVHYYDFNF